LGVGEKGEGWERQTERERGFESDDASRREAVRSASFLEIRGERIEETRYSDTNEFTCFL